MFVSSSDFSMGKQMSLFVLESLFGILQITGVKIALIHAFIPHGAAVQFHKPFPNNIQVGEQHCI